MLLLDWKTQLLELEKSHQWDDAIELMQQVIKKNPEDMDAYIAMCYLLINLLGEEEYDRSKENHYMTLAKWYFDESYAKFSNNPEYLYLVGKSAVMGPWFFDIDQKDHEDMIKKAHRLEPDNPLYNEHYYYDLRNKNHKDPELIAYAQMILSENSPVKQQLQNKGMLGEYIWGLKKGWSEDVLWDSKR